MRHGMFQLIAGVAASFLVGCAPSEKLTELPQVKIASTAHNKVTVDFCTDPAYMPKQYIKMVIILDHSGSNKQNFLLSSDGSPQIANGNVTIGTQYGTDPTGVNRYGTVQTSGTLLNYLNNIAPNDPSDPTRFFALIDFSDAAETYPANSSGFTSDTVDFFNYVQEDALGQGSSPNDNGATDYMRALSAASTLIHNDIKQAESCAALTSGSASPGPWCPVPGTTTSSSYVVVFMSDGAPITNINGIGVTASGQVVVTGQIEITMQSAIDILGQVSALTSLTSNTKFVSSVNLFTIYYYAQNNVDKTAQDLLAAMAKVGNGIAYSAMSGTPINYFRFQPPAKQVKPELVDAFVTNASASWWNDGTLHKDTDQDGLPDDIEASFGTSPTQTSTARNGVSDLVRYIDQNGVSGPSSNYRGSTCSQVPYTNGNYRASDPNGLNDCEKSILSDIGGVGNPDSNGDGIPDLLEFASFIPFQSGTAPAVNQPTQDGYTLYQKVKYSLPVFYPAKQLLYLKPSTYDLQLVSSTSIKDCYHLTASDLPTAGDTDTIRVDILERDPISKINKYYKVGKKPFASGSATLEFKDWNDPAETAAQTWKVWP